MRTMRFDTSPIGELLSAALIGNGEAIVLIGLVGNLSLDILEGNGHKAIGRATLEILTLSMKSIIKETLLAEGFDVANIEEVVGEQVLQLIRILISQAANNEIKNLHGSGGQMGPLLENRDGTDINWAPFYGGTFRDPESKEN